MLALAPMHHIKPARAALRSQLAIVRTLMDEVARLQPVDDAGVPSAQLVEELALLGCRCLEAAAATSRLVEPAVDFTRSTPRSSVRAVS